MSCQLNKLNFSGIVGLFISLAFASSTYAETCYLLPVTSTKNTIIKKTIFPITSVLTGDNWYTDFIVSSDRSFNSYEATIVSEHTANYNVELNLMYGDRPFDQSYKKDNVTIAVGKPLRLLGIPKSIQDPSQIKILVGGINAIGNTYTIFVEGCI
ncbi:hypothetical protein HCU40_17680 [Pseudanabaena biceps]|nr:hypothetical protein [Pseudanabaena biceps]